MEISPVFLHQFHNKTERILHRKGNFTGPVLEMTLVLDHSTAAERMLECVPALLRCLKQQSETFRNVRLNVTDWLEDDRLENRICPMLTVMSDSFYQNYETIEKEKKIEGLYQYLKFYHARSKLILLITDGRYRLEDEHAAEEALKPFLERKILQITVTEKGIELP